MRDLIQTLHQQNHTQQFIAQQAHTSQATVSRELARNVCQQPQQPYQAEAAQKRAAVGKARTPYKLKGDLLTHVVSRLRNWLSPEQICGVLARENAPTTLHHETIYRYIYQDYQTANAQKPGHQPLIGCLGIRHRKRYKQRGKPAKRELIPNRVSIDHRPAIVETNTEVGHWEADTIIGKGHDGVLLTLVERCTKFVLIVKLKSKNALALAKAAVKALRRSKLPLKTITFDNGLEFACHEHIARQLRAVTYFAHPYHSCGPPLRERGLNENTNGLIRQYIPKSCPIGIVRPSDVSAPAARLDRGTIKRPPPQNFGLSKPG